MHALKTLVAAVAATTLAACASAGTVGTPAVMNFAEGPATVARTGSTPSATLHVENYNWMDVVVYAVQGNTRMRLGQVTSMSSAEFRLPSRFLSGGDNVRLMVDPIGSTEGYETDGILVHDGQRVSFSVQNSLQFSSLSVSR
ncbi:MAG: hypothetical protein JO306_06610 [Gemmatimonadetes bacterium]|nr:hypothetical protein [Gemmatimonadota bacterium]